MTATVDDNAQSPGTSDVSTHTVSYTTSPSSGETLVIFHGTESNQEENPTIASGWTRFFNDRRTVAPTIAGFWRESDGTEGGGTVDITTNNTVSQTAEMIELSGAADPDTSPPEAATANTGNSDAPNPPSLSPSGGSDDYRWFAVCSFLDDNELTAGPSGYSTMVETADTSFPFIEIGTAHRAATAASEDPGSFSASNPRDWVAQTIAIYPAAAGGGGANPKGVLGGLVLRGPFGGPFG